MRAVANLDKQKLLTEIVIFVENSNFRVQIPTLDRSFVPPKPIAMKDRCSSRIDIIIIEVHAKFRQILQCEARDFRV